MPYIPMSRGMKRAIVRKRLKAMGIPVDVTESWLDLQNKCAANGLDVIDMLTPYVSDRVLAEEIETEMEDNSGTTLQKVSEPKKVSTKTKQPTKVDIGFAKPKEEVEDKDDDITSVYSL